MHVYYTQKANTADTMGGYIELDRRFQPRTVVTRAPARIPLE